MNAAPKLFEIGSVTLGFVGAVASWRRPLAPSGIKNPMVIITTASDVEDGAFIPAASITICNREGLLALRSAIDEALKEGGAA